MNKTPSEAQVSIRRGRTTGSSYRRLGKALRHLNQLKSNKKTHLKFPLRWRSLCWLRKPSSSVQWWLAFCFDRHLATSQHGFSQSPIFRTVPRSKATWLPRNAKPRNLLVHIIYRSRYAVSIQFYVIKIRFQRNVLVLPSLKNLACVIITTWRYQIHVIVDLGITDWPGRVSHPRYTSYSNTLMMLYFYYFDYFRQKKD